MRIIAGRLGGRNFDGPRGRRTHPMSEKARGGLFSALGDIESLTVLDAFAGSGAISFEAISRGADVVTAVEIDKKTHQTLVKNAHTLQLELKIKNIRANVSAWSDKNPDQKFDIIICDPPYDDLKLALLQKLAKHLVQNGVYVLSWPGKLELPAFQDLKLVKSKNYGDNQLVFYKCS